MQPLVGGPGSLGRHVLAVQSHAAAAVVGLVEMPLCGVKEALPADSAVVGLL